MKKQEKTNVMRLLDIKGIEYKTYNYVESGVISGADVAKVLNQDPDRVFKTLVTVGESGGHYVFMVPVLEELDLKKAARAVNEKNILMIKSKELLPLTGYIHGGCSPIGMKKEFPTVIDETAELFDTVLFSAGKIGYQVETSPENLFKMVNIKYEDIVADKK
ncbi:MAG: Cys-tRNA(Pro) deacylase [Ruminococcaceae bacterium]|nr:Cys-tRNA(Pro) deacylase [Oscillospiraceae bacterium]